MIPYKLVGFSYEECLRILRTYTQLIGSTTCPDVRNDYVQARDMVIKYMQQKWQT